MGCCFKTAPPPPPPPRFCWVPPLPFHPSKHTPKQTNTHTHTHTMPAVLISPSFSRDPKRVLANGFQSLASKDHHRLHPKKAPCGLCQNSGPKKGRFPLGLLFLPNLERRTVGTAAQKAQNHLLATGHGGTRSIRLLRAAATHTHFEL